MMGVDTLMLVAMQCVVVPDEGMLDERLKSAMRYVRENEHLVFFLQSHPSEDLKFRTAVGAVLLKANDEEKERINNSLAALRDLSAMMQGVSVDLDAMNRHLDKPTAPLMKLWHESAT